MSAIISQGLGSERLISQGYGPLVVDPVRFCTVGDLEQFLQLTITNTTAAERAIEGATAAIQRYCNQYLAYVANDVVTLRSRGQGVLILPEVPVTAVASVVENQTALVDETDYTWSSDGLLSRWSGAWRYGTSAPNIFGITVVTYSHGYSTIPQIIREVCIRSASRAYQSGLRTAAMAGVPGMSSEQLPDYQVQYQPDTAAGGASSLGASAAPFLLPSEKEMLNPYRCKP